MVSVVVSYTGIVENGKVTLPPEARLPDDTKVRVEPVESTSSPLTSADFLREFIGAFGDLPADFARNHDHYIHGTRRK